VNITVLPQVNEKTAQKHDYAGPAHRASYARRTAAERTYASLADPSVGGIRRGWSRLFGRAKNTLMYALAVAVSDVRIVESFERREAKEARATSIGPTRRRRRRHQRDTPAPTEQPAPEVRSAPGWPRLRSRPKRTSASASRPPSLSPLVHRESPSSAGSKRNPETPAWLTSSQFTDFGEPDGRLL